MWFYGSQTCFPENYKNEEVKAEDQTRSNDPLNSLFSGITSSFCSDEGDFPSHTERKNRGHTCVYSDHIQTPTTKHSVFINIHVHKMRFGQD